MENTRSLLDHGHVRLVDHMGNDMSVVRAARVSYNAQPRGGDEDAKLIQYLYRNGHTSPFEHVVFTFDVKAPIFVFRQWHRHRTQSYNEISARYTELPEEFYVPKPEHIGVQSKSSKQARDLSAPDEPTSQQMADVIWSTSSYSFKWYRELLKAGCPRELARSVLPVNTYSQMFTTVDLHNLFHFLKLRLHPHAQYEIRVYAEAMLDLVRSIVPECVKAFEVNLVNPTKG
jgi:thymidylate synthase (FAD)